MRVLAGAVTDLHERLRVLLGSRADALAAELDLHTVGDLLHHYPRRYARRGELTELRGLVPGEHVTVTARVLSANRRRVPPKGARTKPLDMLEVLIGQDRASARLVFFGAAAHHERQLRTGVEAMFSGKVTVFRDRLELAHPDYMVLDGDDEKADRFRTAFLPVYPASTEIQSWDVERCVRTVLDVLGPVADPLPELVRHRLGLVDLGTALRGIHVPETEEQLRAGRRRLAFDEAFVLQLVLAQRRDEMARESAVPRRVRDDGLRAAFEARLPFRLTPGQLEVGDALAAELAQERPMHRLLQGEVGSGKTVVALRAMLQVVDAGGQAALLAPTEVLAAQHHRSITAMLGPLAEGGTLGGAETATRVLLLTGSLAAAERRAALLEAASGQGGIVVGTHALLEDRVSFADLGLVVVDEQHRFGVEQRDALRAKAASPPHVLVMTATPIPRTIAMTVFGDLDVATLRELPAGRSPIATHVVPTGDKPHYLERAWERVREEVAAGHQAYVVAPRIGDEPAGRSRRGSEDVLDDGDGADEPTREEPGGERKPPAAVLDVAATLSAGPLAGLRLDVLHGRLPPEAKDDVMRRFAAGDIDVLVATTVVEVGVDVPNASAMVVVDAERFGISQLHQLRGRVGRGDVPGLCLLVTDSPAGSAARARLDAVAATTDGFELSRADLAARREGDVLGTMQSGGRSSLRLLSVLDDEPLIAQARDVAGRLVENDPELAGFPLLRELVERRRSDERTDYLGKA